LKRTNDNTTDPEKKDGKDLFYDRERAMRRECLADNKKQDARIVRTRISFNKAFEELLAQKHFEDISVAQICERSGLKRTTFYKYYTDKNDCLCAYAKDLCARFDKMIMQEGLPESLAQYFGEYTKKLVGFFIDHISIIENIYKSSMLPVLMKAFTVQNYNESYQRLLEVKAKGHNLVASPEIVASTCVGSVAAAIYLWMASGKRMPPEQLASEVALTVQKCLE
jgi:AcrR family transcriptional regulator